MAVYLDYNATAPIRPEAREAALCALDIGGNPSSVHANGRLARAAIEQARDEVAALVGASADAVTFTSGGTEANAMAIDAALAAGSRAPIILMSEHASIMSTATFTATARGLRVEAWPVLSTGLADLDWLEGRLAKHRQAHGRPLVAVSLANNETGVIQPVATISALVRQADGWLHVDAVQAAGKIPIDFNALGADSLSLSAHKLGAPQGVGALVAGARAKLQRRLPAVGQERGLRAGTENLAGIAGFGAAAKAALQALPLASDQALWRDAAAERLKDEGCLIAGEDAPRLPGTLCTVREGWDSQLQVMALDLVGVMVSAGAACSSGKVTPSHVLAAMQMSGLAGYGLRASGGWATTEEDWTEFTGAWRAAHDRWSVRRKVA